MKHNHFARKKRQLQSSLHRLQLLREKGAGENQLSRLLGKIKKLLHELSTVLSPVYLKRLLASVAVFAGVSLANPAEAQNFAPPVMNPFSLTAVGEYAFPAFIDLDSDGDFDLLVGEYYGSVTYYENTGDVHNPQFGNGQLNPFGITPGYMVAMPQGADIDGDGDTDVFIGDYGGGFRYYENTGTPGSPQLASPVANPFGLTPANLYPYMSFADLDDDGDLDLIAGEYYGHFRYYENTGSATNPQFAAGQSDPFGLTPTYIFAGPAIADFDLDGDFDLLSGEYYGHLQYFENTGSVTAPQFAAPLMDPFGLVGVKYISAPAAADLDGDGDTDLMVGDYYGNMMYFENTQLNLSVQKQQDTEINIYPNPTSDFIHIETKSRPEKIEIYDNAGRLILVPDPSSNSINVDELAPGHYHLKVMFDQIPVVKSIIIK